LRNINKEAATIGLLEGIQNAWQNSGVNPEKLVSYFLPESLCWWDSLARFWNKEIRYLGVDIKQH
jgi:hypothetical protein